MIHTREYRYIYIWLLFVCACNIIWNFVSRYDKDAQIYSQMPPWLSWRPRMLIWTDIYCIPKPHRQYSFQYIEYYVAPFNSCPFAGNSSADYGAFVWWLMWVWPWWVLYNGSPQWPLHIILNMIDCLHRSKISSWIRIHNALFLWYLIPTHDDVINWKYFRVTDHLCGEFSGHRWIPLTKASDAELWCFLWSTPG